MKKTNKSFQSVLVDMIIHLRTLETEESFASYQIQDLFSCGLMCIFACGGREFDDVHLHINLKVFSSGDKREKLNVDWSTIDRQNFNRKFWRILDYMARIKILEVELNTKQVDNLAKQVDNLAEFFPRKIFNIFQKNSLKSFQDLIDCRDFYSLIYFSGNDIYSFLGGFEKLWNHLYSLSRVHIYWLSKADSSPAKESSIKKSFQFTLLQKISRLKKMENVFKFHTFEIAQFFGRDVARLLKEAEFKTLQDLIDFDDLYNRVSLFPQNNIQEFHREFSRVYYCFSFLAEMKKRIKRI